MNVPRREETTGRQESQEMYKIKKKKNVPRRQEESRRMEHQELR